MRRMRLKRRARGRRPAMTGAEMNRIRVKVLGLSQADFADRIGYTSGAPYVSAMERGRRPIFARLAAQVRRLEAEADVRGTEERDGLPAREEARP